MKENINAQKMFGKRLKFLRKSCGMTQTQLAQKIGMSTSTIGMYEQGRREPGLDIMFKLCYIFGVAPNELLGYRYDDGKTIEIKNELALLKNKAVSCKKVKLGGRVLTGNALERLFNGYDIVGEMILNDIA